MHKVHKGALSHSELSAFPSSRKFVTCGKMSLAAMSSFQSVTNCGKTKKKWMFTHKSHTDGRNGQVCVISLFTQP